MFIEKDKNQKIEGFVVAEMISIQLKFYLMFVLSAECLLTLREEFLLTFLENQFLRVFELICTNYTNYFSWWG